MHRTVVEVVATEGNAIVGGYPDVVFAVFEDAPNDVIGERTVVSGVVNYVFHAAVFVINV